MTPSPGRRPWLVVPERFRGPTRSGNGGWTAGALARHLAAPGAAAHGDGGAPAATVTLRRPPPLGTALAVERDGDVVRALHDGELVAEAAPGEEPEALDPVDPAAARAAEERFAGHDHHPLPQCVGCGTDRPPGDGMRIFPGPVAGSGADRRRVAATWTPHPSLAGPPPGTGLAPGDAGAVSLATAWAALDCVGGWAAGIDAERTLVLGRMTAAVDALPRVGEEHVVVAEHLGDEGRRSETLATLLAPGGRVVGRARHTWVAVEPGRFS